MIRDLINDVGLKKKKIIHHVNQPGDGTRTNDINQLKQYQHVVVLYLLRCHWNCLRYFSSTKSLNLRRLNFGKKILQFFAWVGYRNCELETRFSLIISILGLAGAFWNNKNKITICLLWKWRISLMFSSKSAAFHSLELSYQTFGLTMMQITVVRWLCAAARITSVTLGTYTYFICM